jgi:hypothetical protein
MNKHLQSATAADLPRLLIQPAPEHDGGDTIGRAITTAGRSWPPLLPPLGAAAALVRTDGVYQVPTEVGELALTRLQAASTLDAILPFSTGLACTCDGWPPTIRAGPGDGLYCADILAYPLAL